MAKISRRRRYAALALAVVSASVAFLLRPTDNLAGSDPTPLPAPAEVVEVAVSAPARTPAATKTASAPKVAKKRSPSLLLPVSEIRVREIRVEDDGWRVTIRGNVWHERRGVIAQPLLRYELRDRDGALVRTGDFTPSDASGPLWIGFGFDGLKAVPFRLDLDLRRSVPGRAPRAPFSARVTPVSVVEARER